MLETWMHRLSPTPFTHAFTGRPLWLLEVVTYEPQDPRAKCGSQICQAEFLISYFSCAITLHTWAARVWQGAYQPPHTSCQSHHISPPFIENDTELESLFSRCSNRGWGGARDRFATIQGHASRLLHHSWQSQQTGFFIGKTYSAGRLRIYISPLQLARIAMHSSRSIWTSGYASKTLGWSWLVDRLADS